MICVEYLYDKGVGCPNKNYTNCLENNFIYVNVEQLYSLFKKKKNTLYVLQYS